MSLILGNISNYTRIHSGSCASHGLFIVENIKECQEAATILGLEDTTAEEWQTKPKEWAYGCIYADNDYLFWYPSDESSYPSTHCGSYNGYHYHDCICRTGNNDQVPRF